jgi:hypothetical protein
MSSPTHLHSNGEFSQGLPPVTPPSGKFIVRLFLVPGLIVALILLVLVPLVWLSSQAKSADSLLEKLRDPNPDVRWRAAETLSTLMPDDCKQPSPRYAFNVEFALDLAEELRTAIAAESEMLSRIGSRTKDDSPKDHKALEEQQNLIRFLVKSLGYFDVPVTAPFLCEIASQSPSPENKVLLQRREDALLALARLGDHLQYYRKLSAERREPVLADLERESEKTGDRRRAAEATLAFLSNGTQMGVETVLEDCARSDVAAVRELAALAIGFWNVDEVEETLIALTHDDGRGSDPSDEQPFYQVQIRNLAVVAFARHGSKWLDKNPQWLTVFAEMLDEEHQRAAFTKTINGKQVVDQERVRGTLDNALNALLELHRKRPEMDLSQFDRPLELLAASKSESLKQAVARVQGELSKNP